MPISLKVQTELDDRSVKDAADKAQSLFEGIGTASGEMFSQGLQSALGRGGDIFSGISQAAEQMGAGIESSALIASAGIAAIGFAAIKVGDELYSVGQRFDSIFDNLAARTGKTGDDLAALEDSVRRVGQTTASSFEQLGDIAGRLTQAFNMSGAPLDDLTQRIANFDRITGETLNIREFGQLLRGFDIDGANAATILNELTDATQRSGVPMNELVSSLQSAGPAARILGLNLEETTSLMLAFEQSGLDASNTSMALSRAATTFAEKNIDLKTGLDDTITQMKAFIDANNEAAAVTLAKDVFGARAARNFVDAVKDGTLSVRTLHDGLGPVGDTLTKLDDQTRDWSENWKILTNNVTTLAETFGGPLFDGINKALGALNDFMTPLIQGPPAVVPGVPGDTSGQALGDLLGAPGGAPAPGQPGFIGPVPVTPGTVVGPPSTGGDLSGVLPPLVPSNRPQDRTPQDIAGAVAAGGGSGSGPGPQIPYPADYTAGPRAGETAAQYSARMNQIEADHKVAQAQAQLDALKASGTAKAEEIQKAENDVAKAREQQQETQLRNAEQQRKIDNTVAIPYAPDFGLGPQPGETTQIYSARTAVLQAQHKAAEELAKLNQMESAGVATQNEIINQKNKVLEADRARQAAEMRLDDAYKSQMEKTTKGFEEIGAVLDRDMGLSKGLPGLAENLVRFMATLGAAPVLGALGAVSQAQGGINATGSGLIGMAGSMGAFGPQYVVGGYDQNGNPISLAQMQAGGGGQQYYASPALSPAVQSFSAAMRPGESARDFAHRAMMPFWQQQGFTVGDHQADRYGEHQNGALDIMVNDIAEGNRVLRQVLQDPNVYGAIFNNQTYGYGHGLTPQDYSAGHTGNPTQDHQDHVHAWYRPGYSGDIKPQQQMGPGPMAGSPGQGYPVPWNTPMQPTLYDGGGILPPGPTLVQNNTGKPETVLPPSVPASQAPNIAGGPGGGGPLPGPAPDAVGQQGPTTIGGGEKRPAPGGGASAGAGGGLMGAATGAAAMAADMFAPGSGAAVQIASQEIQRAIKFGSQAAGIAVGGLMETFLPAGGSDLANNNWLTRIGGAFAGMAPQLPNMAGKAPSPAKADAPAPPPLSTPNQRGGGPVSQTGVHIENYNVVGSEDRAGQDLSRHQMAASAPAGTW